MQSDYSLATPAPTRHDPHCDCGICAYCNGQEDVYGRAHDPNADHHYNEGWKDAVEAAARIADANFSRETAVAIRKLKEVAQ